MVTAECHAHIFMDGVDYKKAAAAHENGPREDLIREHLAAYQKAGISYVRDGGDPYGAGVLARSLAPEYGITYRTPVFAIHSPSSDTPTHLELYKAFPEIGGIVHTHSSYATSWAQAGRSIPCYGTTHADYIYGEVPCLRCLTKEEIDEAYEENTGHLIVNEFKRMGKDVKAVPAVLCKNHGPFTWGKDAHEAVHNAVVLEEVAKMAYRAETINPRIQPAPQELQDKHYYRKHGANAYYGQN